MTDNSPPSAILGIGNPGAEYALTRHNIGWMVLDVLAAQHGVRFEREKKWRTDLALWRRTSGDRVLLLKPQTYVNLSGETAQAVCAFHRIPPQRLLVVVDDLNLRLGDIRVRERGSSGGHNGLKDIEARLGQEYPRLRLGIGAPQGEQIAHVLGAFAPQEQVDLRALLAKAVACCCAWLDGGVAAAQHFNGPLHPPAPVRKPPPAAPLSGGADRGVPPEA